VEIELVKGATHAFDRRLPRGHQTPVFFGSAINNFGVEELLAAFALARRRRCRAARRAPCSRR
jgi:peptide chain release factor 3